MGAQPQTKASQMHASLWTYIFHSESPEQGVLDEFEKDIRPLNAADKAYVTALIYAAKKDYDSAVAWFNKAIDLAPEKAKIAMNYLMYVGISAHNLFHRSEIFRLEQYYSDRDLRRLARNNAFCLANTKLVRKYNLKLSAMADGEEKEALLDEGSKMIDLIENFKAKTKLSSKEIEEFCDKAESIANKHGISCIGIDYFMDEEDCAYVIRAETSDARALANINMELIDTLASEEYMNKNFTSWFKSDLVKKKERMDGC